jgi:hypothetical protein
VILGCGLVEDLDHRAPGGPLLADELGRPVDVVGAEHDVDVRCPLDDAVAVLLGQTAPDHDLHVGAALLEGLELAEVAVQLVVGVLPDAAGVEHDHVGVVDARGRAQPVGLEQAGDALGVVLVHLAPEGAHQVRLLGHGPTRLRDGLRPSPTGSVAILVTARPSVPEAIGGACPFPRR